MISVPPSWLPELANASEAFAAAAAVVEPGARLARLVRLADHRLDYIQTGKLDRLIDKAARACDGHGLAPLRLAWLGSSTLDHLLPSTRVAAVRRGLLVESYVAPYGQYRQELLDPSSELARFAPHAIVLALDPEALAIDAPLTAARGDVDAAIAARIAELRALWRRGAALGAVVIPQTVPNLAEPLFGAYDAFVPGAAAAVIERFNRALIEAAAEERLPVLDLAAASARAGHDAWFDRVRWLQAKQLVAPTAAASYGELLARILGALRGRSRKALVLDLDNTLWGGVVGDDGVERLVLGHGSAAGEAFHAFQHYARHLKERGIVLAVCSKNDVANAKAAFTDHPEMVLRLDDIAVFVANWDDKATNLRRIAEALNLGLDALVFFDDNPAERALVRAELPMVAVPEVPEDPALYVRTLAEAGYFEAVSFTGDDLARARQYQDNGRRVEAMESATDLPTFLAGLAMVMQVGRLDAASLPRVTQLINKTNQFNVTTRRFTEVELRAFADAPGHHVLHFRLADRFGDNGLIAVALAHADGAALEVDGLLMSCRVLGRGVEHAIANVVVDVARRAGLAEVRGCYRPTAKNGMVRELFARLGFAPASRHPDDGDGTTRWTARVPEYTAHPTFIDVQGTDA